MIINDDYIINCFYKNNVCNFNRFKSKYYTLCVEYYLKHRFRYSKSDIETIWCIKHNVDRDKLICPVCKTNILPFRPYPHGGRSPFYIGCCSKCQSEIRNRHAEETCLKKYGTKFPCQNTGVNSNILNKRKQTCLKKYGVEYSSQSNIIKEKNKQTCLKRYGVEHVMQSDIFKDKVAKTCLKKYGVTSTALVPGIRNKQKQTLLKHYGVDNPFKSDIIKQQLKTKSKQTQINRDNTKLKHNTFNVSKPEDECYKLLCSKFGSENIKRQHKTSLYPYCCDFYVSNLDLYIECNFHWTHGPHLYNKNNIKDIILKCRWNQKAKKSKFYFNALKTWTERDIKKNNIFKINNLNYKLFYNIKEFKEYFK